MAPLDHSTFAMRSPHSHCSNESATPEQEADCERRVIELNEQLAQELLPVMLYICLLMVIGIPGNALVCYVFSTRFPVTTQNFLIVWLANFDLLSCLITMPREYFQMRYFYMFENAAACFALRFLSYLLAFSSTLTLVILTLDRYQRVCRPFATQMSPRDAKIAIGVSVATSSMVALPTYVINGIRTSQTRDPSLVSHDCSTSNEMEGTVWPLLYNLTLAMLFLTVFVLLAVLYTLIWRELRRHKQAMALYCLRSGRFMGSTPLRPSTTFSSSDPPPGSPPFDPQADRRGDDPVSVRRGDDARDRQLDKLMLNTLTNRRKVSVMVGQVTDGKEDNPALGPLMDKRGDNLFPDQVADKKVDNLMVDLVTDRKKISMCVDPITDREGNNPFLGPITDRKGNNPVLDPVTDRKGNSPLLDPVTDRKGNNPVLDPVTDRKGNNPVLDPVTDRKGNNPVLDPVTKGNNPVLDPVTYRQEDKLVVDQGTDKKKISVSVDPVSLDESQAGRYDQVWQTTDQKSHTGAVPGTSPLARGAQLAVTAPNLSIVASSTEESTSDSDAEDPSIEAAAAPSVTDWMEEPFQVASSGVSRTRKHTLGSSTDSADTEEPFQMASSNVSRTRKYTPGSSMETADAESSSGGITYSNSTAPVKGGHLATPAIKRWRAVSNVLRPLVSPRRSSEEAAVAGAQGVTTHRTIVIAFWITIVFVISFLPHLVLMTVFIHGDFDRLLRGSQLVAYNIFIRSYLVNFASNPIIFGMLNYRFRQECARLALRLQTFIRKRH